METIPVYVYLDETVYKEKYLGVGALVTLSEVPSSIIETALDKLAYDPDSQGNKNDDKTRARRFFHASEDSPNAHSHLAVEIMKSIQGVFRFSYKPFADNDGTKSEMDFRRNTMMALMTALKSRRPIQLCFERRDSFGKVHCNNLINTMYSNLDQTVFDHPRLPAFYPKFTVIESDKNTPGIQIADFLLWALNCKLFEPGSKKSVWYQWAGGGSYSYSDMPSDNPLAKFGWAIFGRNHNFDILQEMESENVEIMENIYPKNIVLDVETDQQVNYLYVIAERHVRYYAAIDIPSHASHLKESLVQLSTDLDSVDVRTPDKIRRVARMFIRIFDTIPVYEGLARDDKTFSLLMQARYYLASVLRESRFASARLLDHYCYLRDYLVANHPLQLLPPN